MGRIGYSITHHYPFKVYSLKQTKHVIYSFGIKGYLQAGITVAAYMFISLVGVGCNYSLLKFYILFWGSSTSTSTASTSAVGKF